MIKNARKILAIIICAMIFMTVIPTSAEQSNKFVKVGGETFALDENGDLWYFGIYGVCRYNHKPLLIAENVKDFDAFNKIVGYITSDNTLYMLSICDSYYINDPYSLVSSGELIDDSDIWHSYHTRPFVSYKTMENVKSISVGYTCCAAITNNGDMYTWGKFSNFYDSLIFSAIKGSVDDPAFVTNNVKQVTIGSDGAYYIKSDGSLYNGKGEKINNDVKFIELNDYNAIMMKNDNSVYMDAWFPYETNAEGSDGLSFDNWEKVMDNCISASVCATHAAIVTNDNSLYMIGNNEWGQIGDETTDFADEFTLVMKDVKSVTCNGNTIAIKTDGSLFAWGDNSLGQFCNGYTAFRDTPTYIMDNVRDVKAGYDHTAILMNDGSLYTVGGNEHGQLGIGNTQAQRTPVYVMDNVKSVFCNDYVTAAITNDNKLYVFGSYCNKDVLTPKFIMDDVEKVYLSGYFNDCNYSIIKTDGSLYAYGFVCCIDDSKYESDVDLYKYSNNYDEFTLIAENVKDAQTGYSTYILYNDGTLKIYSYPSLNTFENVTSANDNHFINTNNELYDIYYSETVANNVKSFGEYYGNSYYIDNDDKMYMWGNNEYGVLGIHFDLDELDWNVKHEVSLVLDNVSTACLGKFYTGAVTTDGKLYMWGYCGDGQFGIDEMLSDYYKPTDITEMFERCKLGDANNDMVIASDDATVILRYVAKLDYLTSPQLLFSDANGDKIIDAQDATAILRIVAGLEN